jgi:hypothetical protein
VCGLSGEPGGGNEAGGLETQLPEPLQSTSDPNPCRGTIQGKELRLTSGPAPGAPFISWTSRQSDLIVAFPVKEDLRSIRGAGPNPINEGGVCLQRPGAVPVRYHKKRRDYPSVRANPPEPGDRIGLSRSHIVDRDEEHY